MFNFFEKFFCFFKSNEDGILGIYHRADRLEDKNVWVNPYNDGNGLGVFVDPKFYLWLIILIALTILLYKFAKKNPKRCKLILTILLFTMISVRIVNQSIRAILLVEYPVFRAIPWHLCTVMCFMLPVAYIWKNKTFRQAIYTLSMMGGIITVLVNDYFDSSFMTFSTIEGIFAHSILIIIPIVELALGDWKLNFKRIYAPFVGISILCNWATLANDILFKDYNTNYMYLKANELGSWCDDFYFFIYVIIFLIMIFVIYLVPVVNKKIKEKSKVNNIA